MSSPAPDIASKAALTAAMALLRRRGRGRIGLTGLQTPPAQRDAIVALANADGWFDPDLPQEGFDALVVVEQEAFAALMRRLERLSARNVVVIPADPDWIVPPTLRGLTALDAAWKTTPDANYVARSGLRGHYLEFGTFWGRSFFPAYHRLCGWLDGDFYAFDSFKGISTPLPSETALTAGDFVEGAYACNQASFEAIAELCAVAPSRLRVVPGFYSDSLKDKAGSPFGLEPKSVSICVIDCDLYQPTREVLEFVSPLLDDGALIYFDDWRLCRADSKVGERGAALEWLARNPDFELIDFPGDVAVDVWSWQHAWFIFQRR